jgi:hypothetical protein
MPLPLKIDGHGRAWSGFAAEKRDFRRVVRQCILSAPDGDLTQIEFENAKAWPDVSSWYWDTALPMRDIPEGALAITIITESK